MGLDPATIGLAVSIASAAVSAVSGISGMMQAGQQAARANAVARQNEEIAERNRQQRAQAINEQVLQAEEAAVRAKAETAARARAALGSLRVVAGEMGTGMSTFNALVRQNALAEGADQSTVDRTYERQYAAGELQKQGVDTAYQSDLTNIAADRASAVAKSEGAFTSAFLGTLGSGLRIGTGVVDYYDRKAQLQPRKVT